MLHNPTHRPLPCTAPPPKNAQLYALPDMDLLRSGCRFTLPGRAAAYGGRPGGAALLAAAGDDGTIRLMRAADCKARRVHASRARDAHGGGGCLLLAAL
jgi:hypothetical protein